ncbi:hypothetical protein C8R42DRAFT_723337 [Lentinula raphanica]|nr:hypothetical protein C8R42DRAFT_723337 [Lentinula raphanica]
MDTNPSSNSEQNPEPQGNPAPAASQNSEEVPSTNDDVDMLEVSPIAKGKKRSRSDEKPDKHDKDPIEPASKMILLKNEDMSVRYESVTKQLLAAQKLNKRLAREYDDMKSEKAAVQNLLLSTQHQMHTLSEAHAKLTRSHITLLSQSNQPNSSSENDELQNISSEPVSLTGEEVMRLTMDFTNQAQELQNTKELLVQRERELSSLKTEINSTARQELADALAARVVELAEVKSSLGQREKDLEAEKQRNNARVVELAEVKSSLGQREKELEEEKQRNNARGVELAEMKSSLGQREKELEEEKQRNNARGVELAEVKSSLGQREKELEEEKQRNNARGVELAEVKSSLGQREKDLEEEKQRNIARVVELAEVKSSLGQREKELEEEKQRNNARVVELAEVKSSLGQREKDLEEERQRNTKTIEELSNKLASEHATLQNTQNTLTKQTSELELLKEHMNSSEPALNAENETLKTRLTQCQNELTQCQDELARTTESFEQAGGKNLTLASEKDDLADELEEVKGQKGELTRELEDLKGRFEKYQKEKNQELNELARAKEDTEKILTESLETKKEENSKNLETIENLRKSIAEQKVVFQAIILVAYWLTAIQNALEEKESALKTLQMDDEIKIQELRDDLEDSKAELSLLKEQSSLVSSEKVTQAGEIDKLTKENRKLTRELAKATASQQTFVVKQKELQDRVDKLTGELTEKTVSAKNTEKTLELKEKLETSRNERHQKDTETINTLRDEVQRLKTTINDNIEAKATIARRHEDEAKDLEQQLAQAKTDLENQIKQQAELVSKHTVALQEQRSRIVSESKTKHEELKSLRKEVELQKKRIKDLENSAGEASSQIKELETQKKILEEQVGGEWVKRSRLEATKKALGEQEKKVAALQEQLDDLRKGHTTVCRVFYVAKIVQNLTESNRSQNISAIQIERDQLLAEVESLKEKIPATPLTSQPPDLKSSKEIQKLKDNIESLNKRISDYRAEINKLKVIAQTKEPSPEPDETVARLFSETIRGSRRTLSRVNVEAASHKALRKYGLGESIEDTTDPAYAAGSETDEAGPSYLIGQKPKRESPYLDKKKMQRTRKKRKPKVDSNDDVQSESNKKRKPKAERSDAGSSGDEDVYSDQDVESKTG